MILSLVAALGRDRVIGRDGGLPWRMPADLARFRRITMGKPVVMGRRTHASIGRALPGRDNVVVTRDPGYAAPGCRVAASLDAALAACAGAEEVMVIGGAAVYAQALPRAARMYLTFVDGDFEGDTRFPAYDEREWREDARCEHAADARNPYPYAFVVLSRRGPAPRDTRGRRDAAP